MQIYYTLYISKLQTAIFFKHLKVEKYSINSCHHDKILTLLQIGKIEADQGGYKRTTTSVSVEIGISISTELLINGDSDFIILRQHYVFLSIRLSLRHSQKLVVESGVRVN